MSGQSVQPLPIPKPGEVTRRSRSARRKRPKVISNKEEGDPGREVTKRSRSGHGKRPQVISNRDHNTSANSLHIITPSRPIKQLNLFNVTNETSDTLAEGPVKQLNLFNVTNEASDILAEGLVKQFNLSNVTNEANDILPERPVKQLNLSNVTNEASDILPEGPVKLLNLFNGTNEASDILAEGPVKQLNLFKVTNELSDILPEGLCSEILDIGSNPPSKQMMRTPPLGKDEGLVLMTREQFLESCSRGNKCVEKITNAPYFATTSKAKAVEARNPPSLPRSKTLAPPPPRTPNLNLELLPALKDDSPPLYKKICHVISSKTRSSETNNCAPCVQRPIPMSYFDPNILPESNPGCDDGLAKHHNPDSVKSSDAQHATTSKPSSQEHTIKLFGKILKTTITSPEEEEGEASMKHRYGKEPVPSDRIRTDEIAEIKADVVEAHGRMAWVNRWLSNQSRITKMNTDVVREIMMSGSGEEEAKVKKAPSAAAMAMVGRALKGSRPCQIKKMNGYSVWD